MSSIDIAGPGRPFVGAPGTGGAERVFVSGRNTPRAIMISIVFTAIMLLSA